MGPGHRENVIRFRKTFKLYVEFLLNTGLRREEALKLRLEHVDLSQNVIFVEKTKTGQMRVIPLNRRAKEILIELGENLFSKLNKHDVTNKFRHYLEQAGLEGFKLHSLRHTFATRLLSMGVDLYTISRLLGHTDMKTSMIYAKTNVETLRGVVEKLGDCGYTMVTRRLLNEKGQ
jgi:integrase